MGLYVVVVFLGGILFGSFLESRWSFLLSSVRVCLFLVNLFISMACLSWLEGFFLKPISMYTIIYRHFTVCYFFFLVLLIKSNCLFTFGPFETFFPYCLSILPSCYILFVSIFCSKSLFPCYAFSSDMLVDFFYGLGMFCFSLLSYPLLISLLVFLLSSVTSGLFNRVIFTCVGFHPDGFELFVSVLSFVLVVKDFLSAFPV